MPLVIRSFQDLNCRTLSNALAKSFILGSWRPSRGKVESIADSCPWLFNSCFEPQHPGVPSSAARLLLISLKSIRLSGWLAGQLAGWLGGLAGWVAGWLAGLAGWLVGWLAGWLTGLLAGWLAG